MSTTVESTRFGTLEVGEDDVLELPDGLIGLEGSRYALVSPEPGSAFRWLHSLEDPALALPVTPPWTFFPDYEVALSDEATERLGLPEGVHPDVWVTIRATADPAECTANLRAPILVHGGKAHQVINEAKDAPVRAPLLPAPGTAAAC